MQASQAIHLIEKGIDTAHPQNWADLGCGAGTFTLALAELLPAKSCIYAVDAVQQKLPSLQKAIEINFQKANFEKDVLLLPTLNGILMANALHYVKDKRLFLQKTNQFFGEEKRMLIVEYDTLAANRWVPFPVNFAHLTSLFLTVGYTKVEKLGEYNSAYGGKMYAALALQ